MEILQIAPTSKVMYGSDGFNMPELLWFSAKVGKSALQKCFLKFHQEGVFNEDEINQNSKRILFDNANELYKLKLS
jgi:predicted TIM-barrel fold metal-dependent hydrolase